MRYDSQYIFIVDNILLTYPALLSSTSKVIVLPLPSQKCGPMLTVERNSSRVDSASPVQLPVCIPEVIRSTEVHTIRSSSPHEK
ncbi:hypothetical protein SBOR_1569 [Sclerotinia borealis F-4128]|uniref:Uncharacterized protein n=1 Tax=Sclerotinia borealis (strain F-4128) TaxID=1432307 RepID=W9CPQ4_SCLBF|nr:hypothetical protein SBOR_1569 [Sclerotinia borealis F-4128]